MQPEPVRSILGPFANVFRVLYGVALPPPQVPADAAPMANPIVVEILFICTGNYYRSRFAEALFNFHAEARALRWRAFSRGVDIDLAPPGLSPPTKHELQARGIPFHHTTPERHPLTAADLTRASRIIALKEAEHRAYLQRDFPA